MALPVGSGMFTFRSERRKTNEPVRVSPLVLVCKVLPAGTTVNLDASGTVPRDKRDLPEFHAGVAAALRIAMDPGSMDLSDISFNKPETLTPGYAGILMGLGLTGHLRSMASYQAFTYLDPKHELTSIGLLLGLSAAFVATCDPKVTSVLSVHLAALHPNDASSLNVTQATQAAGMLGLGLLYLGTRRRKLADVALKQLIGTRVVPLEGPETCREAYTLACGFAYGMIMLGAGKDKADDADILRTLRNLVSGDGLHDLPSTKNSMASATDVALTSPAATVALALVYLDSGRTDVADSLEIPQSVVRFDYVRPDLILLRTLAKSLIVKSSIRPTTEWVEALVPAFILKAKLMGRGGRAGSVDVDLAYWSVVAGACMAIGLAYAGTANGEAHATMIRYFDQVRRFAQFKGVSGHLGLGRQL
jgi:anaphase-promoting complex subunit 1